VGETLDNTLTTFGDAGTSQDRSPSPFLFLAIEYDRPMEPAARYALANVDKVVVGRGAERRFRISQVEGLRVLSLEFPDRRMSSRHARIERAMGQWLLVDMESKNGVSINGERTQRAHLADGDYIELGHTLFSFRSALPSVAAESPVLEASAIEGDTPGLATLLPSLEHAFAALRQVAQTEIPVLIRGETGTGKELVARAIHTLSDRAGKLVAANCGGMPDGVFESQMFGHRKGAFSGAVESRTGVIRGADGGTLLLDEIGDLLARPQAALLRALQEGEVVPVGESDPIPVDVRVIAATHQNLEQRVETGEFRADLLGRLNGFEVTLPALRDRREDLGLLIGVLLRRAGEGGATIEIQRDAVAAMYSYSWPLNVRELQKCLASAVVLATNGTIGLEHLPDAVRNAKDAPREAELGERAPANSERERITEALRQCGGNQGRAAKLLGISRRTLSRWLDVHDIPRPKKT
jgi:DNA-binding NtrC family response regulator